MTTEERKRLGRKLRALRTERGLHQADVVADPKADKLSLGTLQAIESGWYEVRDVNLEKYARFFGTTVLKLLRADEPRTVAPSDPLLKDLHEEHLEIARSYMQARKRVRAAVELLLTRPAEDTLASLLLALEALPPERLAEVAAFVAADPEAPRQRQVLERARARAAYDTDFILQVEELLNLLDRGAQASPAHTTPTTTTRPSPTRRARR
jgi:transcriptional regulator with XRE-family HTH domain